MNRSKRSTPSDGRQQGTEPAGRAGRDIHLGKGHAQLRVSHRAEAEARPPV